MIQQSMTGSPSQGPRSAIEWLEPSAQPHVDALAADQHAGRLGAGVAIAICALIAWVGWLIDPNAGWMAGVAGMPATALIAWQLAAGSIGATFGAAAGRAFGLTIGTILLTDAFVVTAIAVGGTAGAGGDVLLGALQSVGIAVYLYVIGALVVGIPVSVIVVPAAFVWVFIVRWLASHGWAR